MKFDLLSSASLIAIGGALTLSAPGAANATLLTSCGAGCLTETIALGATTTDFLNLPLNIDQFSPLVALPPGENAVLTSVVISESGSYTSSGTLHNTAAGPEAFNFKFGESLTMSKGTGAPLAIATQIISTGLIISPYNLTSGAITAFSQGGAITPASLQTLTTGLAAFNGTGTFQMLLSSATTEAFTGGGGNVTPTLVTSASPSITITYDYTLTIPAPEPASLAVFGAALAGIGVVRRRRNKV